MTESNAKFSIGGALVLLVLLVVFAAVVSNAIRHGRRSPTCAMNLKSIGHAITHYQWDSPPHLGLIDFSGDATGIDELAGLKDYVRSHEVFICPSTQNFLKPADDGQITREQLNAAPAATITGEGKSYQSRGRFKNGAEITLESAAQHPGDVWLVFENDTAGSPDVMDANDNHGELGGNILLGDFSVLWLTGGEWTAHKRNANQ